MRRIAKIFFYNNSFLACINQGEEIPLNKIIQLADGNFLKCAISEVTGQSLIMRPLKPLELDEHLKHKTLRLNLVEYFASGSKSSEKELRAVTKTPLDECEFNL